MLHYATEKQDHTMILRQEKIKKFVPFVWDDGSLKEF